MKTTRFLSLMAAVAMMLLTACNPDPIAHLTDGVTVTTAEPAFVSGTTASCGAEVTADDNGLLLELGVCWSKNEKPTIDNYTMSTYRCSQPYTCLLTQLEPNTRYHVRAYAKYGTEYCYGEEKTFNTLGPDAPVHSPVTTLETIEITYCSFMAGAKVEPFGINSFTVGICYSTHPEFTMEDSDGYMFANYDEATGNFEAYCIGLNPSTQYYYRAFVAYGDENGTYSSYFYGDILSFTTPERPFILNINTDYYSYAPYGQYIYVAANGYCSQPELINQVGLCYSLTDEYPEYESDLHTTAATPTGEYFDFGSTIYNISANKKYYIRSYARYKVDSIKYGNVIIVNTY